MMPSMNNYPLLTATTHDPLVGRIAMPAVSG
jgi:hypothetical protein